MLDGGIGAILVGQEMEMHRVGVIQAKSQLPALMDETENDGRLPIDLATFVHDLRYKSPFRIALSTGESL